MEAAIATPTVSVLMPTYKQAVFLARALASLRAQTLQDWELIILNDGSPDDTDAVVAPYLEDNRIQYHRWERNQGIGAALNHLTQLARGRYIAYLPSDDVYYPEHLARLTALLDAQPDSYLAYGRVRYAYNSYGRTPHPEVAASDEQSPWFAMVQVVHRRELEGTVHWTSRTERATNTIDLEFWQGLFDHGARSCFVDELTSEWLQHRFQHHKLMDERLGGLSRYRAYYNIGRGEFLKWQPTKGVVLDEHERFGRFNVRRDLPAPNGLKILLVGELGFNPERIMAFEEHGHKLYGLWIPDTEPWDFTGPLPYGNIEDIPFEPGWIERVRAAKPDVIYALLNVHALRLIDAVLDAKLDIPIVFHFKEGPFIAHEHGTWPILIRILRESAGQVLITPENREWFQLVTGGMLDESKTFILDGDLPKLDWMTDEWAPKLSAQDGEIHTVCPGRPLGLDPFDEIARAGIHVHFYGRHFQRQFPNWTKTGLATGYMHLHPTVEPAEWVSELSQYDAAWFHVFDSFNQGDLQRAIWDDLNLPARLGTYAAAGLPWILKDNRPSRVAVQQLALEYDVGVYFSDFADLARQLRERSRVAQLTDNMRRSRKTFAFDTHVPDLTAFFRQMIDQYYQRT